MTKASDNLFPKVILNEAATDGSDFSNPSADYRVLFLGEDGELHLKDSSGTVTDVAGAGGDVATDAIWDAAGDLAVGSGANTATRLAKGSDEQVLRVTSGTVGWGSPHGAWTSYTPTWSSDGTGPTLGDGSLVGRYKVLDSETIAIAITFIRGSTTSNGTGNYTFTIPSAYKAKNISNFAQVLSARFLDSGTAHYAGVAVINNNTTTLQMLIADATAPRIWGASAPVALATNDEMDVSGILYVEPV